jgi:predicted permease
LQYDLSQGRAWGHHLRVVGRMRPGVAAADAAREMDAIARNPVPEFTRPPHASAAHGFIVASLKDDVTRGIRPALLAVFGAVALVLVIACVNVTNLLLARGVRRRGELALRAALGAGRHRLVRQLLTESLLLASLGGIAGLAVAVVGVRALVPLVPAGLPRAAAIGVGGGAFGFALGLTTFVGLVFGLVPAFQGARSDPQESLVSAGRRSTGRHRRVRGALVVAEVAVAVVVLAGAGLLLRSIQRLFAVPAGFDPSSIVTMRVETAGPRLAADSATARFFAQALDAVRRVAGVASAALTSQLPLSGERDLYGLRFDGAVADDPGEAGGTLRYAVSPGYFETMRIPVRRGRRFDERDRAGAPLVAVISESVARRRLPGLDPLGRQVTVGSGAPYTVVGVVGDVRQALASSDADAVYVPAAQWRFADRAMSLVVRARGAPAELVPALRRAVWSADRGQAIERVATMNHLLTTSVADRRFALLLFEVFALVAVVLAAAGIYGVLATGVAERTREVGVRAALGATPSDIVGLVLREGMLLAGVGVLLGLAGAAAASRAVVSLLFGVSRVDPVTYGGVVAVLGTVALLAGAVPAWRAARVDPMEALRAE